MKMGVTNTPDQQNISSLCHNLLLEDSREDMELSGHPRLLLYHVMTNIISKFSYQTFLDIGFRNTMMQIIKYLNT
jgi:hypothetical protein